MTGSPSDLIRRKPWPIWRRILAYLLLIALSSASIWLIDRLAMHQAQNFHDSESPN
jgi:hypothetical protein